MTLQWTIDYLADTRIVRVTTQGEVTFAGAISVATDLLGPKYIGAIVFPKDTDHDFRFYQWRAANAGFRRRMFTEMDAALQWLGSNPRPA